MPCGPVRSTLKKSTADEAESDVFSFAGGADLVNGMAGLALMWSTPWRAAMVVAAEAWREGGWRS